MKRNLFLVLMVFVMCLFIQGGSAQAAKLTLATADFEPFCSPTLTNQGFYTEIVSEAFKRVGYDIEVEFMPFPRVLMGIESGKYDGSLSLFQTKEREKILAYTEPITSLDLCFFQVKGKGIKYEKLEDLTPYSIGITRGGLYTPEFNNAAYLKKFDGAGDTNLNKLFAGRLDLVLSPKISTIFMVKQRFPDKINEIEALPKPLSRQPMVVAISKKKADADQIVKDFNRGFKMMKDDGSVAKIKQKHNISD